MAPVGPGPWLLSPRETKTSFLAPHSETEHPVFVRYLMLIVVSACALTLCILRYKTSDRTVSTPREGHPRSEPERFSPASLNRKVITSWLRRPEVILISSILAVACAIAAIIYIDSERPGGEPLTLTEGISVWPSVLIRFATIAIGMYVLMLDPVRLKSGRNDLVQKMPGCSKMLEAEEAKGRLGFWGRVFLYGLVCLIYGIFLFWASREFPNTPSRGNVAYYTTFSVTMTGVVCMILVTFYVLERFRGCVELGKKLIHNLKLPGSDSKHLLLAVQTYACRTAQMGRLIYFPFLIVLLMVVARNRVFDNWDVQWPLAFLLSSILAGTVLEVAMVRATASKLRDAVLELLSNVALHLPVGVKKELVEGVTERVKAEKRGAFRPLFEDPVFAAIAIPFGGTGTLVLIEKFIGG